jgi:arylsulfatase A-like enzyme
MKVLVLIARGLQAGLLGCYGNRWIDTPALDTLAANGVVFDQHFADCADTKGAHQAWRSGLYYLPGGQGPGPSPDVIEVLRERGIHTCLIAEGNNLVPAAFAQGWDDIEQVEPGEPSDLEPTLDSVQGALDRLADRDNWLLWVEVNTPLPPWNVPEEYQAPYFEEEAAEEEDPETDEAEEDQAASDSDDLLSPLTDPSPGPIDATDDSLFLRLQGSCAAAVSYLDAAVGQLLGFLANSDDGEDVVILFTTDVGQALGEHGAVGPVRPWLHEELVHLPLILVLPEGADAGSRIGALTQAVDLAPTLAALFGAKFPQAHGHNLLPLVAEDQTEVRPYAVAGIEMEGALEYALRTPEWAFLLPAPGQPEGSPRPVQLYVKPDDRWEVNNVVQHHLELTEQLEKTLRAFVAATRQPGLLQPPPLPAEDPISHG